MLNLITVSLVTGLALGIGFAIPIALILKWRKNENRL